MSATPLLSHQTARFETCYATLTPDALTIGNDHIERRWQIDNGRLFSVSFRDHVSGQEWLTGSSPQPVLFPFTSLPNTPCTLHCQTSTGVLTLNEAPSLQVELSATWPAVMLTYIFQIFPASSGISLQIQQDIHQPSTFRQANTDQNSSQTEPSGVEQQEEEMPLSQSQPRVDVLDHLPLARQHLRLLQVLLRDQTDNCNELVVEREWLLHPSERGLKLSGNLFIVEDTLTQSGLIFVKESPPTHAQPVRPTHDFEVEATSTLTLYGHGLDDLSGMGYRATILSYRGGKAGRIGALQTYQQQRRLYQAGRDGILLSNTWGDRSRDSAISESFLAQEITVAARLGIDVLQIDDGWQRGRSANSIEQNGVWESFWENDAGFWKAHPQRLPHGLTPLVAQAKEQGVRLGLWFAPDSSDDFSNWQRDAEALLDLYRVYGITYFKIDAVNIRSKRGERHLYQLFSKVQEGSQGEIVFDTDVTAGLRPGYFGLLNVGPVFVENRYTDWHNYWPHQTLRNLWKLTHYINPVRLRMEFLNNMRNQHLYAQDPLAPATYALPYLFAITMVASPLAWCELSHLPVEQGEELASLIQVWKEHRAEFAGGIVLPMGAAPDGTAWTGFLVSGLDGKAMYALVFRELNERNVGVFENLPGLEQVRGVEVLAGEGEGAVSGQRLTVAIPEARGFLFFAFV